MTQNGKPALRRLNSLVREGATPDVLQLVFLSASQITLHLTVSPEKDLDIKLDGTFGSIVCPIESPPAERNCEMIKPLSPYDAGVVVRVRQGASTGHVADITVESAPVIFEFRNQILMQAVDYIDRCIIGVFTPLKSGRKASAQPLWRVSVPSARMLMPTSTDGTIEFTVGEAHVANSIVMDPTATQRITVDAANVSAHFTRERAGAGAANTAAPGHSTPAEENGAPALPPPASPGHRRSPLPLLEELEEVHLVIRSPLRKVEAASHGQSFVSVEILPLSQTIHLGLCPDDLRTIMSLWFDNFQNNYSPPPDPTRDHLPRETTMTLALQLRLSQVIIWLHQTEASSAVSRLELRDIDLDVAKSLKLISQVKLSVSAIWLHGRWQSSPDHQPIWLPLLGPTVSSGPDRGASASQPRTKPPNKSPGANPIMLDLCIGNLAGLPDEIVVHLGEQALFPLPLPVLALNDFMLAAAVSAVSAVLAQQAGPPKEQHVTVSISQLQICVLEPQMSADAYLASPLHATPNEAALRVPAPWLLTRESAQRVRPHMLLMSLSASVEIQKNFDRGDETMLRRLAQDSSGGSGALVQQVTVHASHNAMHMLTGYLTEPQQRRIGTGVDELLSVPAHGDRIDAMLTHATTIPSAADELPCVLERFVFLFDLTARPQYSQAAHDGSETGSSGPMTLTQRLSIMVQDPICISANVTQLLFMGAVARQWALAIKALPPQVPEELVALTKATGEKAFAELRANTMSIVAACPYVQVTVLSAEILALPLLQLSIVSVGDEAAPLSVSVEKHAGTPLLATEAALVVQLRFYNAPLFAWEPVIEPFEIITSVRSGGTPALALNMSVEDTLDLNITDAILCTLQANVRAAVAAHNASIDEAALNAGYNLINGGRRSARWPVGGASSARESETANADESIEGALQVDTASVAKVAGVAHTVATPTTALAAPGSVPSYLSNQTGGEIRCWMSAPGVTSPSQVVVLPPGSTKLLQFWDEDASTLLRDWREDGPREVCVQLEGAWEPLAGLSVSTPGTMVVPLERRRASDETADLGAATGVDGLVRSGAERSVVCEVELHARGTRLTVRSMLTLVNMTRRLLIADLFVDGSPPRNLGLIPAGGSLPLADSCLGAGGVRLIDAGDAVPSKELDEREAMRSAVDEADAQAASGRAPQVMWLPELMSMRDPEARPLNEDEMQWRTLFGRKSHEHLLRAPISCSLGERAGDLYLGSHGLHFRASGNTLPRATKGKERLTVSLPYERIQNISKKSGKRSGYKGFVLDLHPTKPGERSEPVTLSGFAWANDIRHLVESLANEHSRHFDRAKLEENVAMRFKFRPIGLEDESQVILHEYKCLLVVSEASSKGKLYVTQGYLCFSGSLFGRDTRAIFPIADVISLEKTESPAPNSILVTSSTNEERFIFYSHRGHAYSCIMQLLAVSRQDHSLMAKRSMPTPDTELPPEPFLEQTPALDKPASTLPLALSPRCLAVATSWHYPVRAPLSTGCPATVLIQPPLALHNLLPCSLEWRLVPPSSAKESKAVVQYQRLAEASEGAPKAANAERSPGDAGGSALATGELPPEQLYDFHDLPWTTRWGLQLRLPGFDWSATVFIDVQSPNERTETVRLRSSAVGAKSLRVQLRHRASCARARHMLQVYVSYWLVNRTGVPLQFKRRKQLAAAADMPNTSKAPGAAFAPPIPSRTSSGESEDGGAGEFEGEDEADADDDATSTGGSADGEGLEGDHFAGDKDTLLYAVPKGARQGLHCIAVRVVEDGVAAAGSAIRQGDGASTATGWSPPFSLVLGPFTAERAFRAGLYDLAVDIRPAETAARSRTKVVTFVQRFWLTNRMDNITLEVEQWGAGGVQLDQPLNPLAIGERAPFHWPHPRVKEDAKLLRIRAAPGQGPRGFLSNPDEGWSSGFPIDTAGRFVVHCEQGLRPDEPGWWESQLRVMVNVQTIGACIEVIFAPAPLSPPPYRIDNRTAYLFVARQKGAEGRAHTVKPYRQEPFAWKESSLEQVLLVSLTPIDASLTRRRELPAGLQLGWKSPAPPPQVAPSERQQVRMDALMQSVPLLVSGGGRQVWAHVGMQGGVRVLTLSTERLEPPSEAGEDEPHTFLGFSLSGLGVSIVHAGHEELLYLRGQQLTVDWVLSQRTATCEMQLSSLRVDNQQAAASLTNIISITARASSLSTATTSSSSAASSGHGPASSATSAPTDDTSAAHLSIMKNLRREGGAVDWWDYVSFRLLEVDVALEPSLVQALLAFGLDAQLPGLVTLIMELLAKPPEEELRERAARRVAKLVARSELLRYGEAQRRWYFGRCGVRLNANSAGPDLCPSRAVLL